MLLIVSLLSLDTKVSKLKQHLNVLHIGQAYRTGTVSEVGLGGGQLLNTVMCT